MKHVPHIPSFRILLGWFYRQNEDELYKMLVDKGHDTLIGFACNCRFWGIVDPRLLRIVEKVLETKFNSSGIESNRVIL